MIKLFWNSHNQINSNSEQTNKELSKNKIWGLYHKKNSDKWIFEILKEIKFTIVEDEQNIENGDNLIIVDSSVENKEELYKRLKLICSKIFLIHLGDESGMYNLSKVYDYFNHVWRVFCFNKYFNNKKVSCLPIGYKSGTYLTSESKNRKYKWSFIGTPHKSSRHDLLFQLSNIKPSFLHTTKKFNEKIIDVEQMSSILSSTKFVPCPNGFVHPETYRLYEALECESVPIVEDAYSYYDRLFPKNPFLKVSKWSESKTILNEWGDEKINMKKQECKNWWSKYKINLQKFIKGKIYL